MKKSTSKGTKKANTSTPISSSLTKEPSKQLTDPLELGKLLVRETMVQNYEDTLTVWMAHYLAELIARAEREGDSPAGRQAKSEASSLVLKLWEHRAELSGRANPMKQFEDAVKQLNTMDADGFFSYGTPKVHDAPLEEFQQSSNKLFTSLFLLALPNEIAKGDIAERNLSKVEQKIIKKFGSERSRRFIIRITPREKVDPKEVRKKEIHEEIARVREALMKLEENVDALVEAFNDGDDGDHDAIVLNSFDRDI